MTAAEGIYLLIFWSLAFALGIAVVIEISAVTHVEKRRGHCITPPFAPLIVRASLPSNCLLLSIYERDAE